MFRLTLVTADDRQELDVAPTQRARRLTDVLRTADLPLNTRCGQRGLCHGCMVELIDGAFVNVGSQAIVDADDTSGLIQACQLQVPATGAATIHVPTRSRLAHRAQIVSTFRINVPRAQEPLWQAVALDADEFSLTEWDPDAIARWIGRRLDSPLPIQLAAGLDAEALPDLLSHGCSVGHWGEYWRVDRCTLTMPTYGAAIDVGTTTVVVALVELTTGTVVSSNSALNTQIRLGDNVLTRINACMLKPGLVTRFQDAVTRQTLQPLLQQALDDADVDPEHLVSLVVAGNSTMLHLLAGVNPASMGTAPFTPEFLEHRVIDSRQLGLVEFRAPHVRAAPAVGDATAPDRGSRHDTVGIPVHLLPGSAAYVGADITAGVLATGMAYRDRTCLLVDLGTNGEIVLKHAGKLVGCATAAGPAFEGAGLTFGTRAGRGAIAHIGFDAEPIAVRCEVIDDVEPIGICGTAYIDVMARARQAGLLSPTGRLREVDNVLPLVRHETHGVALVVAHDSDGKALLVTEADIASLLQAKAAIAAGITCLLRRAGLTPHDIDTVFLAGGFGFHMHVESLIGCGMLPGFVPSQVELVGNTALAGAYLALLDVGALDALQTISRQLDIIELNLEPGFETVFIDQLVLP